MARWPYNTPTWRRLRLTKLADQPLCEPCRAAGRIRMANTVDHKVPVEAGGDPFPALGDLTSMCPSCHGRKTAQEDRRGAAATKRRRGRGVDPKTGRPLDPQHWWNSGKISES